MESSGAKDGDSDYGGTDEVRAELERTFSFDGPLISVFESLARQNSVTVDGEDDLPEGLVNKKHSFQRFKSYNRHGCQQGVRSLNGRNFHRQIEVKDLIPVPQRATCRSLYASTKARKTKKLKSVEGISTGVGFNSDGVNEVIIIDTDMKDTAEKQCKKGWKRSSSCVDRNRKRQRENKVGSKNHNGGTSKSMPFLKSKMEPLSSNVHSSKTIKEQLNVRKMKRAFQTITEKEQLKHSEKFDADKDVSEEFHDEKGVLESNADSNKEAEESGHVDVVLKDRKYRALYEQYFHFSTDHGKDDTGSLKKEKNVSNMEKHGMESENHDKGCGDRDTQMWENVAYMSQDAVNRKIRENMRGKSCPTDESFTREGHQTERKCAEIDPQYQAPQTEYSPYMTPPSEKCEKLVVSPIPEKWNDTLEKEGHSANKLGSEKLQDNVLIDNRLLEDSLDDNVDCNVPALRPDGCFSATTPVSQERDVHYIKNAICGMVEDIHSPKSKINKQFPEKRSRKEVDICAKTDETERDELEMDNIGMEMEKAAVDELQKELDKGDEDAGNLETDESCLVGLEVDTADDRDEMDDCATPSNADDENLSEDVESSEDIENEDQLSKAEHDVNGKELELLSGDLKEELPTYDECNSEVKDTVDEEICFDKDELCVDGAIENGFDNTLKNNFTMRNGQKEDEHISDIDNCTVHHGESKDDFKTKMEILDENNKNGNKDLGFHVDEIETNYNKSEAKEVKSGSGDTNLYDCDGILPKPKMKKETLKYCVWKIRKKFKQEEEHIKQTLKGNMNVRLNRSQKRKETDTRKGMMKVGGPARMYIKRPSQRWENRRSTGKEPKVPNPSGDFSEGPRKGKRTKKLPLFGGAGCGRQCSNNGGGGGSNSSGSGKQTGTNNNNNNSSGKNAGSDGYQSGHHSPLEIVESNLPARDYKFYKKREHGQINDEDFEMFLGNLSHDTGGHLSRINNPDVAMCVAFTLQLIEDQEEETANCTVCLILDSMLRHFASCIVSPTFSTEGTRSCQMCLQIFTLICIHINDCNNNNHFHEKLNETTLDKGSKSLCTSKLCLWVIQKLEGKDLPMQINMVWIHIRGLLGRILDGVSVEAEDIVIPEVLTRGTKLHVKRPSRTSTTRLPLSLPSIPENETIGSPNNSRPLSRKKSNLASVEENKSQKPVHTGTDSIEVKQEAEAAVTSPTEDFTDKSGTIFAHVRPETRDESEDVGDALPTGQQEGHDLEGPGSGGSSGDYTPSFVQPRGRGNKSLPMDGFKDPQYFISVKEKPTGIKGIDEVVYADKAQLVRVVGIWEEFKSRFLIEAKLQKHVREEGVILKEYKISHLGNGMTGKCHLAKDFETDFMFCVKEMHISHYEKEEITLWSELDHPFIVQIYGAIRHGEKIYILQEFIAADNILLNTMNGSVSIKMTDFGLSRRIQGTPRKYNKLVGTQTQWSPEKAKAIEYSFPAEVWAAVCVLIVEKSPPVEDIPANIDGEIRDLILQGFTLPQRARPSASDLLRHPAFVLLENGSPDQAYSLLPSMGNGHTSHIQSEIDMRLHEIVAEIDKGKSQKEAASKSQKEGASKSPEEASSKSQKEAAYLESDSTKEHKESAAHNEVQPNLQGGEDREVLQPSLAVDPYEHLMKFFGDDIQSHPNGKTVPPSDSAPVVSLYMGQTENGRLKSSGSDTSLPKTSDELINALLPKFEEIGLPDFDILISESLPLNSERNIDTFRIDSAHSSDYENMEEVEKLDSQEAMLNIIKKYIPEVVNQSESMTESTSRTDISDILSNTSFTDSTGDGKSEIVPKTHISVESSPPKTASDLTTKPYSPIEGNTFPDPVKILPDNNSISDDDFLFMSGSPPKTSHSNWMKHTPPTHFPIGFDQNLKRPESVPTTVLVPKIGSPIMPTMVQPNEQVMSKDRNIQSTSTPGTTKHSRNFMNQEQLPTNPRPELNPLLVSPIPKSSLVRPLQYYQTSEGRRILIIPSPVSNQTFEDFHQEQRSGFFQMKKESKEAYSQKELNDHDEKIRQVFLANAELIEKYSGSFTKNFTPRQSPDIRSNLVGNGFGLASPGVLYNTQNPYHPEQAQYTPLNTNQRFFPRNPPYQEGVRRELFMTNPGQVPEPYVMTTGHSLMPVINQTTGYPHNYLHERQPLSFQGTNPSGNYNQTQYPGSLYQKDITGPKQSAFFQTQPSQPIVPSMRVHQSSYLFLQNQIQPPRYPQFPNQTVLFPSQAPVAPVSPNSRPRDHHDIERTLRKSFSARTQTAFGPNQATFRPANNFNFSPSMNPRPPQPAHGQLGKTAVDELSQHSDPVEKFERGLYDFDDDEKGKFGIGKYCLQSAEGELLDVDTHLDSGPRVLFVVEGTDNDPWWADSDGFYFNPKFGARK
ncbi:STK4-like protein [Mya arenaria]|uniref:non-specific serine/threonine protein kinase n=1 Tax=Mya arenaria TaxID=6604 RepID=A0ABY7EYS4_MYAAR|nr:STK4-like protein [Mya arenaria]